MIVICLSLQAVLALDFHPTVSVLASGSNDCTVKFFDYSRPAVKKSYRSIAEVASIKSIKFHPSGEFMVVGTEQPTCMSLCCAVLCTTKIFHPLLTLDSILLANSPLCNC